MHATKKYALWRPNKYRKCRMLCMQPRNIHFGDQTNTGNTEFYAHNQEICTLETNKHMKYRILCTQPRNTKSKWNCLALDFISNVNSLWDWYSGQSFADISTHYTMVTIVIQFNYTFQYISIYIRIHFSYSIQLYISDNMLEKWGYPWRLYLKTIPVCLILSDKAMCYMCYEWTWLDQIHASVPRDLTWHYSLSWGEDQRASMQDSMLIWRRILFWNFYYLHSEFNMAQMFSLT